jgi:hypothetical protein
MLTKKEKEGRLSERNKEWNNRATDISSLICR